MPYLDQILGDGVSECAHPWEIRDELPLYVFRVMSEAHFQQSLREGVHCSDQRGCYIGQKAEEPEAWAEEDAPEEGIVAGRWVYLGYLLHASDNLGRIVKIEVRREDGWELHPWDEEGGYIHTFQELPAERFVGWSEPFEVGKPFGFRVRADGSARVHLASPYPAELLAAVCASD